LLVLALDLERLRLHLLVEQLLLFKVVVERDGLEFILEVERLDSALDLLLELLLLVSVERGRFLGLSVSEQIARAIPQPATSSLYLL